MKISEISVSKSKIKDIRCRIKIKKYFDFHYVDTKHHARH